MSIKNDGHYFCRAGGNRPDGLNEPVTINLIFQLKQEWMFLAGRGAFPLFALVWGLNLSRHAH
ncbi:TraX family protein, partial [Escherichia coli]|nr:TraX family protein [Escherichia coli]